MLILPAAELGLLIDCRCHTSLFFEDFDEMRNRGEVKVFGNLGNAVIVVLQQGFHNFKISTGN